MRAGTHVVVIKKRSRRKRIDDTIWAGVDIAKAMKELERADELSKSSMTDAELLRTSGVGLLVEVDDVNVRTVASKAFLERQRVVRWTNIAHSDDAESLATVCES